ncbi:peroxiredoxin family protein [Patescibacteria group bacterium]|nr:peroxiredoxin family protein [Patescibacteria group bacterium]
MELSKAKNFQLKNTDGKQFDLYEYQDDSLILLVFFRGEWCKDCREQLTELNANYLWFKKKNIKIVAVSSDDQLFTSILREIIKSKFPILSDHSWKIFELYGFKRPTDEKRIKPALFLFNAKHQILYQYIGKSKKDRPSIKSLKKLCDNN